MGSTSNSKSQKLSMELTAKQEEDRISNLPNNLIAHILSFMPTKYAVATSVLSRKWERYWTLITSLEFDDKLLLNPQTDCRAPAVKWSFIKFVYRVLFLCRFSCFHKFHLQCSQYYDVCHIKAWVASVLKANVQKLSLYVELHNESSAPESLFTCSTLVELKLRGFFLMNVPTRVVLPCLKILHIGRDIKFSDDDSVTRLLSGCPLLEELSIIGCIGFNVRRIEISAPLLTSLFLCNLSFDSKCRIKIMLKTPILSELVIRDLLAEDYMSDNLYYLNKAHITIVPPNRFEEFPSDHVLSHAVAHLFKATSRVIFLRLEGCSMEAIRAYQTRLPTFERMTHLELGLVYSAKWKVLPQLLEKSPRLRTLTFVEGLVNWNYDEENPEHLIRFCPENNVPNCFLFHLKTLEIRKFYGWNEEIEIVKYFLENAVVLEKVIIRCPSLSDSEKRMVSKKLPMLPRASRCLIVLL